MVGLEPRPVAWVRLLLHPLTPGTATDAQVQMVAFEAAAFEAAAFQTAAFQAVAFEAARCAAVPFQAWRRVQRRWRRRRRRILRPMLTPKPHQVLPVTGARQTLSS